MKEFVNKVVIVTGSSKGIGKAVARIFAQHQAKVVLNGRNPDSLKSTEIQLKQQGFDVLAVQGDVSKNEDCAKLVEATLSRYGRLDILINNAGISMRGKVEELSPTVIDTVFQINTIGPFMLTQMAIPHIKKTKGSIVFVSSLAGLKGLPNLSVYSASKMALTALVEALRVEHAEDGLHVGLFYAGFTEIEKGKTTMGANGDMILLEERTGNFQHSIEYVADRIVHHTRHRKKQSRVGVTGYLYSFLVRQFPSLTERMITSQYKKVSKVYR